MSRAQEHTPPMGAAAPQDEKPKGKKRQRQKAKEPTAWQLERGRILREAREAKGLKQTPLAKATGVHQSQISNIEKAVTGERVAAVTLSKLERGLGLPPGRLSPPSEAGVDDRAGSLERFLHSPWAESLDEVDITFLRGVLAAMRTVEGPVEDHFWYVCLQAFQGVRRRKAPTVVASS